MRKVKDRAAEPGMEMTILRRLPRYGAAFTFIPMLVSLLNHWFPVPGTRQEIARHTVMVDALSVGAAITGWTAVLTVAIGCCIVAVMKGPTYEADSYPMQEPENGDEHWKDND